jgi:hypothetical protein
MKWAFFCVLVLGAVLSVHSENNGPSVRVSLCDVVEHPTYYSGKSVVMTVRILATKDGTSLWNPTCKKYGIRVKFGVPFESKPGLLELHRALSIHGLGDHPVIATLTGVFENNNYDEILHRSYPVLKIIDAIDIKISQAVERPY